MAFSHLGCNVPLTRDAMHPVENNPKLHKLLRNENSTMESSVLRKAGHPPKRSKKKTSDAPFGCMRSPRQQKRKQNR